MKLLSSVLSLGMVLGATLATPITSLALENKPLLKPVPGSITPAQTGPKDTSLDMQLQEGFDALEAKQ